MAEWGPENTLWDQNNSILSIDKLLYMIKWFTLKF